MPAGPFCTQLEKKWNYRKNPKFWQSSGKLLKKCLTESCKMIKLCMKFQDTDAFLPDLVWAAAWQNQQYGLCVQRRLRSTLASAQSDQSLLCTQWVAKDLTFLHADSEDSDQTAPMPGRSESSLAIQVLLVLSCCGSFREDRILGQSCMSNQCKSRSD